MVFFSSIILPLVYVAIRLHIIDSISYKDAGFWEAMTRISKYYLLIITSVMAYYILPKFKGIKTLQEFKKQVFNYYKRAIPILILVLGIIYLLRHLIVNIIFTYEFQDVTDLFFWQLVGDFFKVISMVVVLQFIAKNMFWHYIVLEAFLCFILYTTSIYFIDIFGLQGVVMAHLTSYLMYFGLILLIFNSSVFGVVNEKLEL